MPDVSVFKTESEGRETVFINRGGSISDVNKIVPAYRLYTDVDLQKKLVYVEASRGCPFGCEFCLSSIESSGAGPVREFPLEPFLAEMKTLIERGGRQFKFLDRTFNLNIERAERIMEFFLDRIKTAGPETAKGNPICVHFEIVPFHFPPVLKELIRQFPPGSLRLEVGIQTFNSKTASLIHRMGNTGEEIEILEFLRNETNAIVHVDLIAGLPGEDLASFGAGFDRLWQVLSGNGSIDLSGEIQLGILKCLPGTSIARHNEAYGMRYSAEPPYEVIGTSVLPESDLDRIKNFARFWELIVNRNPFPVLLKRLLVPGKPAFDKFMNLSGQLLDHFGRNWGIEQADLRKYLEDLINVNCHPSAEAIQSPPLLKRHN